MSLYYKCNMIGKTNKLAEAIRRQVKPPKGKIFKICKAYYTEGTTKS